MNPVIPTGVASPGPAGIPIPALAHGLAALDEETLRFLVEHPAVVTQLYERDSAAFAAFADHLRIRHNRVVPPGGDRAVPLWEAVIQERVAHPERFVRALFARNAGRLAYLYDTIGHLDAARASFALGFGIEDASLRVERFGALARVASESFNEWDVRKLPFSRPSADLLTLFSRLHVDATGAPGFPAARWVWARAFAGGNVWDERAPGPPPIGHDQLVDAAWLAENLMSGHSRWRMERLDQFGLAQRVFATADAADLPDVLLSIRAFPRVRMLMLTLERIGVRQPALYAALARQANRVWRLDEEPRRTALAQFQGAIALVDRLTRVRTIDRATAETLLTSLAAVPVDPERGYRGALVPWLQLQLRPALGAGHTNGMEHVLVEALAGARRGSPPRPVSWEGQHYRLDFAASEAVRLRRFREHQDGPSIDLALTLHRIRTRPSVRRGGVGGTTPGVRRLGPRRRAGVVQLCRGLDGSSGRRACRTP